MVIFALYYFIKEVVGLLHDKNTKQKSGNILRNFLSASKLGVYIHLIQQFALEYNRWVDIFLRFLRSGQLQQKKLETRNYTNNLV